MRQLRARLDAMETTQRRSPDTGDVIEDEIEEEEDKENDVEDVAQDRLIKFVS